MDAVHEFSLRWQYPNVNKEVCNFKFKKVFFYKINLLAFNDRSFNYSITQKVHKVPKLLRRGLDKLLLRSGDVETNPGPEMVSVQLSIITYNIRGLKEYSKLKRVLNSCADLIKKNRNTIICLQETHLERSDENKIRVMWRENYVISPGGNKSRGCIILYDNSWDKVDAQCDPGGRFAILTVKKPFGVFTIANIYAPNEQNISFFENVILLWIKKKDEYDSRPILVGDFNLVIDPLNDSLNRNSTNVEIAVSSFVKDSLKSLGVSDSFRHIHKDRGYTWSRGNCYSRLDMIYIEKELLASIESADIDWTFDKSDHALVKIVIKMQNIAKRGPGLPRVDPALLSDPNIKNEVVVKLQENINTIPTSWNPHQAWEFIEVTIRSIMWEIKAREVRLEVKEKEAIREQINRLKSNREIICSQQSDSSHAKIESIDQAITHFEEKLNVIWEKKSKDLANKAGVKWFNEGEKSNKYFLNIIKKRQAETNIDRLEWEGRAAVTQGELKQLVVDFYGDLYEKQENLETDYDSFFSSDTPSLGDEDRSMLDGDVTLEEITRTLHSCEESAPGPDGITYKTYQALWEVLGSFSLKAWNYSLEMGNLPSSQKLSSITLLPKEGKDLSQIGNWRPITLTNCDLKIYTKNMANRVSLVLDKIIFKSQTAYIPGRNVHNNSRMYEFYRDYCNKNNIDAVLLSLDAKKAFDSVDHRYMTACLKKYGFSDQFIDAVRVLYNDIKADILVNGYRTTIIKIARCVKQGDALSCALFIICLDPLIRNIERNKKIKSIEIRTPLSNSKIEGKTGAFADDVGIVTAQSEESIREIFLEYRRFSVRSGITLNEGKSEIMKLNGSNTNFSPTTFHIDLPGGELVLKSVQSITICGIMYSNNTTLSHDFNVKLKIDKLKKRLLAWQYRGLSLGGKILITNTFGISQLIYSMQVCEYYTSVLTEIERFIFAFLWSKNVNIAVAPDRIKRIIMKQDYDNGGLRVPDIRALNSALKLKQFFGASNSNHIIKLIQKFQLEKLGFDYVINQEYSKICKHDNVIETAQIAINSLTDNWRKDYVELSEEIEGLNSLIASIDVKEFLLRHKRLMSSCLFERLFNSGIEKLKQLVIEKVYPRSDNFAKLATLVLKEFPSAWETKILSNIEADELVDIRSNFYIRGGSILPIKAYTVKSIRKSIVFEKQNNFKYNRILNIQQNDGTNPFITNRIVNHATSQRIFKFRLLHLDIFTKERMYKFKMTQNDKCDICGEVETVKHAIWECSRAKRVWELFRSLIRSIDESIGLTFENLFVGYDPTNKVIETMITRITQSLLSFERNSYISDPALKNIVSRYAYKNKFIECKRKKINLKDIEKWERVLMWCSN